MNKSQKTFKKLKKKPPVGMPSLTIDGKRAIVSMALAKLGEPALTDWLKSKNIPSIRYFQENIRKYKMAFFKELYTLTM
jgi:hypothetical protein